MLPDTEIDDERTLNVIMQRPLLDGPLCAGARRCQRRSCSLRCACSTLTPPTHRHGQPGSRNGHPRLKRRHRGHSGCPSTRLNLMLVNARHAKNLPGRKTDISDAQWLTELAAHGLVRGSFVPPWPIRRLRDLTRQRTLLTAQHTREVQRLEKLLESAGIKYTSVATRVLGVSGRAFLDALIAGESSPLVLANLAKGRLKNKTDQLRLALDGTFTTHHGHLTRLLLDRVDLLDTHIADLTTTIEGVLIEEDLDWATTLLATIPGISDVGAQNIIAETGADMNAFATPAQLASWAGVCPGQHESAGRHGPGTTRHGNAHLKGALGIAAKSAARTNGSFFQHRYRKLAARRGPNRHLVAIEHSIHAHRDLAHPHPTRALPRAQTPRRLTTPTHPGPTDTDRDTGSCPLTNASSCQALRGLATIELGLAHGGGSILAGAVVRNITWVDVDRAELHQQDVHIPGEHSAASVVDGSGLFAIPGLVDMHVHVCRTGKDAVSLALANLSQALTRGTTAVRDLGAAGDVAIRVREVVLADPSAYPALHIAGPAITAPGGHGARSALAVEVRDLEGAIEVVDRLAVDGVDVVKVIVGSGSAPVGFPELLPDTLVGLIDRAHQHGLPVAAHANFKTHHLERAIDSMCDMLEHGTLLCDIDDDRLNRFGRRGGAYCPTLSVLEQLRVSTERDEISVKLREAAERHWPKAIESVTAARGAGIAVVAGTDAGAADVAFGTITHEIQLLHTAGLSTAEALQAATTTAERYLTYPAGRSDRRRDVVLLGANPLEDLSALDDPVAVVRSGRLAHLRDPERSVDD